MSCLCTRESKRNFCSFVSFLVSNYPREINLFWHLSSSQLFWRQKLECIIFFLGKESRNSQQFLRIIPWVLCANGPICVSFKRWFVYLSGCLFSKNLLPTFSTEQHFRTTRRMYIIDVYSPLFLIKRLFLITRSLRLKKESQNDILMIYWELIKNRMRTIISNLIQNIFSILRYSTYICFKYMTVTFYKGYLTTHAFSKN